MATGDVVLPILQISPLLFTVGLRLLTHRFHHWWHSIVTTAADAADQARAGNFEMYTLFAFDWFQATYALSGSFLYTSLFVLYTAQRPAVTYTDPLTVIAVVLFAAGIIVPWKVNEWFTRPDVEPHTYCRFFYEGNLYFADPIVESTEELVKEAYWHPWVSPGTLVLVAELLLLLVVGGLSVGAPYLTS